MRTNMSVVGVGLSQLPRFAAAALDSRRAARRAAAKAPASPSSSDSLPDSPAESCI